MNRAFYFAIVAAFLIAASAGVILFARGLKPDFSTQTFQKTGMIAVKSRPDGAKVYLDDKLLAATNNSLSGLKSDFYDLKIVKEGFFTWEKKVEVKEELVTEVDALLIPLSPALSPLTNTGIQHPALSSNRDRIAFVKEGEKSGIYQLSLTGNNGFLGILRGSVTPLALDTPTLKFSAAQQLSWSADDSQMLIQMNPAGFYLIKPGAGAAQPPEATTTAAPTFKEWGEDLSLKNKLLSARIELPEALAKVAAAPSTLWSPDEKKFIYKRQTKEGLEYWVHDGSKPLGVARRRENFILHKENREANLSWFSDSEHLILVEDGIISLIEVDGGKKTQVYSGNLASGEVFPTPAGDKLIILTKFIEGASPNLYAISLR